MSRKKTQEKSTRGDRHLRVGEEIRHALADIFLRGDAHTLDTLGVSVTVTEVRVSTDLRHAAAYVMPLGGQHIAAIIKNLQAARFEIRQLLARRVKLQFVPQLEFRLDTSFAEAEKINKLLAEDEAKRQARGETVDG